MTSYAPGTALPGRMPRPTTVTAASVLLLGAAALNAVIAVTTFAVRSHIHDKVAAIDASNVAAGMSDEYLDVNTVLATFGAFAIAGVMVLGLFGALVLQPRQGIRVTAIVFTAISLAVTACFGAWDAILAVDSGTSSTDTSSNLFGTDPVTAVPTWYGLLTTALEVLSFLVVLVALILLSQRSVGLFYRSSMSAYGAPGWPYPVVAPGYMATYPGAAYPGAAYPGAAYPGTAYPGGPYQGGPYQSTPYQGVSPSGVPYQGVPSSVSPYSGWTYSGMPDPSAPYPPAEYPDTTLPSAGSAPTEIEPSPIDISEPGRTDSDHSPWEPPGRQDTEF